MDSLRLGRVLGTGARHAAKTLLTAADAVAAPNPRASAPPAAPARPSSPPAATHPPPARSPGPPEILPPPRAAAAAPRPPQPRTPTARGLAEGSRRFGRAIWAPAVRLSGVLWLELTGVFFGLFALVAAIAAWHLRGALRAGAAPEHTQFFAALAMLLLFTYFSASSFRSASRRGRAR